MLDDFPPLNDPAEILYTGTHENRFLKCKSLKKLTKKFIYEIPKFSSFYPKYAVFSSNFTKLRSFGLLFLLRRRN